MNSLNKSLVTARLLLFHTGKPAFQNCVSQSQALIEWFSSVICEYRDKGIHNTNVVPAARLSVVQNQRFCLNLKNRYQFGVRNPDVALKL